MTRIRSAILILSVLVTGCGVLAQIAADSAGVPLSRKYVADKREPRTLVAEDGATCTVTAARFRRVQIGEHALCGWSDRRSAAPWTVRRGVGSR